MFPLSGRHRFRVSGSVSPGFEPVRAEFEREFSLGRRRRAQCCAYRGADRVVDLWGESEEAADEESSVDGRREYDGDSLHVSGGGKKSNDGNGSSNSRNSR